MHLDIHKWGPSTMKELKDTVPEIRKIGEDRGRDLVFAYTTDKKITKLWKMCLPYDDIEKVEDGWVGAWDVEIE